MKKENLLITIAITIAVALLITSVTNIAKAEILGAQTKAEIDFEDTDVTDKEIDLINETFKPSMPADSFFYGFKRFFDGLGEFFTFDAPGKAKLHLRFAQERLAEANEIADRNPVRARELVIEYEKEVYEIERRVNESKGIGINVSIIAKETEDNLLKSVYVLQLVYEKVPAQAKSAIEKAINNSLIKKDKIHGIARNLTEEEIEERIETALEKHKERLISFEEKFRERLESKLEKIDEEIEEALEKNQTERAKKLEELRAEILNKTEEKIEKLTEKLEKHEERVRERLEEKLNETIEKVSDMIQKAEEKINETENKITENNITDRSVLKLIEEAKDHLEKAKIAFDEKKYGAAFGLANSAWRLARNAEFKIERIEIEEETEIEELEIEAKIKGNQTEVEIENSIDMEFTLNTIDRNEIISEILSRTNLTREEVEEVIKFKTD